MTFKEVMEEIILPLVRKQWEEAGKPGEFREFVKKTIEEGIIKAEKDNKILRRAINNV